MGSVDRSIHWSTSIVSFVITREQAAARDRVLAAQYYLVKQGSLGEIFRCGRCKGKHSRMTLMCVERPYSGLIEGLIAYYKVLGTPQAYVRMSPAEQQRMDTLRKMLGPLESVPHLGLAHPELARGTQTSDRDIMIGSVALGILEPISAVKAQQLQDKINMRGIKPRLALPGLRP